MEILDYLLHIDKYLETLLNQYQNWFYIILFLLIFIETGLVVMPFLPGDSLLFASGMLAAAFPDQLNIYIVLGLLWIAAILGDTVNYTIGKTLGTKLVTAKIFGKRIIQDSAIQKTWLQTIGLASLCKQKKAKFKRESKERNHVQPQPAAHAQIHCRPSATPRLAAAGVAAGALDAELPGCLVRAPTRGRAV